VRILIYGINYAPELTGIGKYTGEMAAWLAAQGQDVRVVAAPPYYPEWKIAEGYFCKWYGRENLDGVEVWRCPVYVPGKPSGLKRILHLASFALSSLPVMLRQIFWRPDVVFVVEPPLFCAPAAWLAARLSGGTCWLHIQDFEVDAAFDLGIIRFAWMKRLVSAIESWLMRRFDTVSTISHAMLKRLGEKGIEAPVLFPNWADLTCMTFDQAGAESFRKKLNIGEPETLCLYSGNIAVKQGLEILFDVAQRLPDCRFVICGDGANRKSLQEQAESLALSNVIFLPLQPLGQLTAMLSSADIHLVIQKTGAADLVMPSKLTNILAVGGHAIVTANDDTELGQLAKAHPGVFEICTPDDADSLVRLISSVSKTGKGSGMPNAKARRYAEDYLDRDKILTSFAAEVERVVRSGGKGQ